MITDCEKDGGTEGRRDEVKLRSCEVVKWG